MEDRKNRLTIAGCKCPDRLDAIFASFLVDVAYLIETTADGAVVVADDPDWPEDSADYEWMCEVIRDTLANHKITGLDFSLVRTH